MPNEIFQWSQVAASNGLFPPGDGGWPEGMSRQDVNGAAREDLAAIRRWYNDPEWIVVRIQGPTAADGGVFARTGANVCTITLAGVDLSGYFTAGRVVKVIDGSGLGVDLVTQCSIDATYGAGVTTITTKAAINVAATDIVVNVSSVLRAQGLLEDSTEFFIPASADSAGIQGAIDAADLAGGGIVFLNQASYSIATQIDITGTKGNVIIWGKSPQVTLLRTAGIGSIINFSNASKSLEIRNVKFDGDWLANPSGNGYGLSVAACLSVLVDGCEFARCESGIRFTGASSKRIAIRNSSFTFHRYGISTAAVSDTHEGVISGCVFDGTLQSLPAPASMRLSGQWLVSGNHLRNFAHASLVPIGIYVWDRTVPDLGGVRSTVVGNTISGGAATGTAILMGTSDCSCIGNVISGGSGTTGIRIGSNTASAQAERVMCQGNTIQAGSLGIQVTEFARHGTIIGNSLRPNSGTGLLLAGDLMKVSGNVIRNCPVAIDIIASAAQNSVTDNSILDVSSDGVIVRSGANSNVVARNNITGSPPRGFNVEAGALDTFVLDNYAPSIVAPVTNASTTSRISRNQELVNPSLTVVNYVLGGGAAGTEWANATGIDLPGGGGIGTYYLEGRFRYQGGFGSTTFRLRAGVTGVIGDPVVASKSVAIGAAVLDDPTSIVTFTISDATQVKICCTTQNGTSSGGDIVDWDFWLTKASEPLG